MGYSSIRLLISQKLEDWINTQIQMRIKDFLTQFICLCGSSASIHDGVIEDDSPEGFQRLGKKKQKNKTQKTKNEKHTLIL